MNRQRKEMDVKARANISTFPMLVPQDEKPGPSWIRRLGMFLGVIMAAPESPKGWTLNPATVTLALTVMGMIAFGGWYVGVQQTKYEQMNDRLQKAEEDQRRRVLFEATKSGATGHAEPTPVKGQK